MKAFFIILNFCIFLSGFSQPASNQSALGKNKLVSFDIVLNTSDSTILITVRNNSKLSIFINSSKMEESLFSDSTFGQRLELSSIGSPSDTYIELNELRSKEKITLKFKPHYTNFKKIKVNYSYLTLKKLKEINLKPCKLIKIKDVVFILKSEVEVFEYLKK